MGMGVCGSSLVIALMFSEKETARWSAKNVEQKERALEKGVVGRQLGEGTDVIAGKHGKPRDGRSRCKKTIKSLSSVLCWGQKRKDNISSPGCCFEECVQDKPRNSLHLGSLRKCWRGKPQQAAGMGSGRHLRIMSG